MHLICSKYLKVLLSTSLELPIIWNHLTHCDPARYNKQYIHIYSLWISVFDKGGRIVYTHNANQYDFMVLTIDQL